MWPAQLAFTYASASPALVTDAFGLKPGRRPFLKPPENFAGIQCNPESNRFVYDYCNWCWSGGGRHDNPSCVIVCDAYARNYYEDCIRTGRRYKLPIPDSWHFRPPYGGGDVYPSPRPLPRVFYDPPHLRGEICPPPPCSRNDIDSCISAGLGQKVPPWMSPGDMPPIQAGSFNGFDEEVCDDCCYSLAGQDPYCMQYLGPCLEKCGAASNGLFIIVGSNVINTIPIKPSSGTIGLKEISPETWSKLPPVPRR